VPMEAGDVLRVLAALDAAQIAVWLDGGWGIDALVGWQTRPHDDLDLVIALDEVDATIRALAPLGFAVAEDLRPVRIVLRAGDGRGLDLHTVIFDADGNGLQPQPDGTSFAYTRAGLAGRGSIAGQPVRCLTAELQVACHMGYVPDVQDVADMRMLRDTFGLTLPPDYQQLVEIGERKPPLS
jgi:lincosamide nucleotidyltransferase A/C/D/E